MREDQEERWTDINQRNSQSNKHLKLMAEKSINPKFSNDKTQTIHIKTANIDSSVTVKKYYAMNDAGALRCCMFCDMKTDLNNKEKIMSVTFWAESQPSFRALEYSDKSLLVKSSWKQLYSTDMLYLSTLTTHPWKMHGNIASAMSTDNHFFSFSHKNYNLERALQLFKELRLDAVELSCLKLILLQNPDVVLAASRPIVGRLQIEAHLLLLEHVRFFSSTPSDKIRVPAKPCQYSKDTFCVIISSSDELRFLVLWHQGVSYIIKSFCTSDM